jgi:uncharacterized protein (TIGR00297 family)
LVVLLNLAVGVALSSLIGLGGYYKGALSASGAVGAIIVGTAIFGFGGWVWGAVLIIFFVSSSLLSSFRKGQKADVAEKFDKDSRRDLGQALANGGLGAGLAAASAIWPSPLWWFAFLGALGAVNADTWATELGVLSKQMPRLISSGAPVPAGTSGGVTWIGTLAALSGGLLIGLAAWVLGGINAGLGIILAGGVGGLAGALFDSLLGATLQAIYRCRVCRQETEKRFCCGQLTRHSRGLVWLNNDLVNFISSIVGALAAFLVVSG